MTDQGDDFIAVFKRRHIRLREFLGLRRRQLGLTTKEVEDRIQRKACRRFDQIESGQKFLSHKEYPYVEQALELPPDFINTLAAITSPYEEASAEEILTRLGNANHQPELTMASGMGVKTCYSCASQVRMLQTRYSLSTAQQHVSDKTCVCGGRPRSDSDLLLRLALLISGKRSFLILGGSEDIEQAVKDIEGIKVKVALGTQRIGSPVSSNDIANVDVIIVARGKVAHATTAPYANALKALKSLPGEERPIILYPRSSNITGIAEEAIWNLGKETSS